ncbi:hypothetical protein TH53_18900 [Pedobacter lusitanus]|uniref:Uncharacterized protein n=1 Tax=Pedobacter lusitanus TaxID=1503925 RepID=A0A0D0GEL6_9SPHI|nr:hypothetical protein [Pedobacter lusitanus]KIO75742.1 hypothetical protein TH53_18900 [Pedobacter lusitanus]
MNQSLYHSPAAEETKAVNASSIQITEHQVEYLSSLTALRGIAALLVAVFHFEMAIARFVPASQTMFF